MTPLRGNAVEALEIIQSFVVPEARRLLSSTDVDSLGEPLAIQPSRGSADGRQIDSVQANMVTFAGTDARAEGGGVERFEILERLGAGDYGDVWRAKDTLMERVVALKFVPKPTVGNASALAHARALSRLSHPNIVPVFDVLALRQPETNIECDAVVMEYVPGDTLAERVQSKNLLDSGEAMGVALAVLDAVEYLHARNVVHGDLHLANVLISGGRTRVIDPTYGTFSSRSTASLDERKAADLDAAARLIGAVLLHSGLSDEVFRSRCPNRTIEEQRAALEGLSQGDQSARAVEGVDESAGPAAIAELVRLEWHRIIDEGMPGLREQREAIRADAERRGVGGQTWAQEARLLVDHVNAMVQAVLTRLEHEEGALREELRGTVYWQQAAVVLVPTVHQYLRSQLGAVASNATARGFDGGNLETGLMNLRAQAESGIAHTIQTRARSRVLRYRLG